VFTKKETGLWCPQKVKLLPAAGGHPEQRKKRKMKTTVLLYKKDTSRSFMELPWWVSTYKGDTIPAKGFETAKAARAYAKSKKWSVLRSPGCDEHGA
jgi:hypothetical protein